ncbi:MAG: GIY-YIG nuclease family protein [Deltaproteobacteria bacterium]|nr:GIY-YIG nuclease family protein [Deltaproteobacteria bacterium]
MSAKQYYTYILTNKKDGTLYVGTTSNLIKRIYEHKHKFVDGFTQKYQLDKLVHYEIFDDPENAIHREKKLKKWDRNWKVELIEKHNPHWNDLYQSLL